MKLLFKWVAATFAVMVAIIAFSVALITQSEPFRELLRERLLSAVNDSIHGQMSLGGIEGSLWPDLVLSDLVLRDQGVEILTIPRIAARYAVLPLLAGELRITSVEIAHPSIRLEQDAAGDWNVLEAVALRNLETESKKDTLGIGIAVQIDRLAVSGAEIGIRPEGRKGTLYRLSGAEVEGAIALAADRIAVDVRRFNTRIELPPYPVLTAAAELSYHQQAGEGTVEIKGLTLASDRSRIRLAGGVADLVTLKTDAQLVIDKLAAEEVAKIAPQLLLKEDVSGRIDVKGTLADLIVAGSLQAGDAKLTLTAHGDLSTSPARYQGQVSIAQLDIERMVDLGEIGGVIHGEITAAGMGDRIPKLTARADLIIDRLRVGEWQLGTASINARIADAAAKLSGAVRGALGQARWQGSLLLQEVPRYALELSVQDLDLKHLIEDQASLGGRVSLEARVKGRGMALREMDAQASVTIHPSTVGPVSIERGRLDARIENARVKISRGMLRARDTIIELKGDIGTAPRAHGELTYALQVGELAPWLELAGQEGSGEIALTGSAAGSLDDLSAQGELRAAKLSVAGLGSERAAIDFALRHLGRPQPEGTVAMRAEGIESGIGLETLAGRLTLIKARGPAAQLELRAKDRRGRAHHLHARLDSTADGFRAELGVFRLELPNGTWALAAPARIHQEAQGFRIEGLAIKGGNQSLLARGRLSLVGPQDFQLQLRRLDLAAASALLPKGSDIAGQLSAVLEISGTADAPVLSVRAEVDDPSVAGQAYAGLSGRVVYARERATLAALFRQDTQHALRAEGRLPVSLRWAPHWEAVIRGDMELRVRSKGLSLAFVNALGLEPVRDITGELSLDVRLGGAITQPRPRGSFALRNGGLRIVPLGVTVQAITVEGKVDPSRIRVERMRAEAQQGYLNAQGAVRLQDGLPGAIKAAIELDRWPAIWTKEYQARLSGEVRAAGTVPAPEIKGQLEVLEAVLKPNLAFLEDKPVRRDETIVLVPAPEATKPQADRSEDGKAGSEGGAFENLALDVGIRLHPATRIEHPNAEVELEGDLRARQPRGGTLTLAGALETVRGWAGFKGRRFTLREGRAAFTGGETINPLLNIVASHRLPGYTVDLIVGGSLNEPSLDLQSEPHLEPSDILALLLFGKPVRALSRGEQRGLQHQTLDVLSGYAASMLAESVSEGLGLADLGIDLREVDFSGGRIGFARYLTPDTRIGVSQELAGEEGQEVSIEYQLAPRWNIEASTHIKGSSAIDLFWRWPD